MPEAWVERPKVRAFTEWLFDKAETQETTVYAPALAD